MSDSNIVELVPFRAVCNDDVVDILSDLLERAQAGEIVEVAVAWVNSSRRAAHRRSSSDDLIKLYGAISLLQSFMGQELNDEAELQPLPDGA